MAKLIVNIGDTANDRNADSLRTAFTKINENFSELYTTLGINDGSGLNLGAFEFNGSVMSTTDSTPIIIDQATTVTSDLTVGGDILPSGNLQSTLGSPTNKFHSLYVGTGSVYIGDARLSLEGGTLNSSVGFSTDNLTVGGVNISVNENGALLSSGGFVGAVAGSVDWDNVQNKPTIPNITGLATAQYVDDAVGAVVIPDVSNFITAEDIPAIPADISDLTDTDGLLGSGGGSITVGDGGSTSVENVTEILINGTITEIEPGVVGITVTGSESPIQPYLELTNSPFIIQPVVLGSPVTVSTTGEGSGAQVEVVIGEGPVITSVTVTTPGTGYTVGQRYRVQYWEIGGNNDDSHIEFEVATVSSGGLLTVTDVAFTGETAANNPGTYSNLGIQLRASPGDSIGPGLTLVRSYHRALFNIEAEAQYDRNNNTSPLGTEWNSEGWGNLTGFNTRTYTTFYEALNGAVGNNIIGAELVMHDTVNDQYYKFSFSNWGDNNGGSYAYTRTQIERDPNYFIKENYATANNVDVIEDDSTLQIGITRGNNQGIYNPFTEEGWDEDISPDGTLWNIDGWDDLTDVETRTYTTFYNAYDQNIGNNILG
jgi:hypothetical protein